MFEKLADDLDPDIRLLRAADAAAKPLRSILDAEKAGLPVALIEPRRNGLVQHGEGTYDIRIAIATKMGLPLAGWQMIKGPTTMLAIGPLTCYFSCSPDRI